MVTAFADNVNATYAYRPDGLRHSKETFDYKATQNTVHLWDGQNICAEQNASGIFARYLRGVNLIARRQDDLNQYFHFNAHGDVVQDYNGVVLKNYDYDAFGVEKNPEPLDSNPFRYCAEYFGRETKTVYLRARVYSPALGCFTSEDSAKDGLNWYTYCGNNPIGFIDPSGHFGLSNLTQLLGGSIMTFMGFAAAAADFAALSVATGGLATVAAIATIAAGGGLATFGAYEMTESVTGVNGLRNAFAYAGYERGYYDSMTLLSMGSMAGMQYSAEYAYMHTPAPAINQFNSVESQIINEVKSIESSVEFSKIREAYITNRSVTVTINGRIIQYEPGLNASGMTMFGVNGFLIGNEAFISNQKIDSNTFA